MGRGKPRPTPPSACAVWLTGNDQCKAEPSPRVLPSAQTVPATAAGQLPRPPRSPHRVGAGPVDHPFAQVACSALIGGGKVTSHVQGRTDLHAKRGPEISVPWLAGRPGLKSETGKARADGVLVASAPHPQPLAAPPPPHTHSPPPHPPTHPLHTARPPTAAHLEQRAPPLGGCARQNPDRWSGGRGAIVVDGHLQLGWARIQGGPSHRCASTAVPHQQSTAPAAPAEP